MEGAAAAAHQGAETAPDGWVLVPRIPTVDMVVAATEEWLCIRAQEDRAEVIWDAMIAAAPSPGDAREGESDAVPVRLRR